LVAYAPFTANAGTTVSGLTATQSQYVHREVIDIRQTNEAVVKVPYVATVPWLPTDIATGDLRIYVLDSLKCPATVVQSVSILCEWAADDDFELAIPDEENSVTPVLPLTPQMGEFAPTQNIGGASSLKSSILQHSSCMGEKICSLRSLIKRITPWYTDVPLNTGFNGIYHRAIFLGRSGASTYTAAQPANWLVWVKSWFALERGSYRIINRDINTDYYVGAMVTHFKGPSISNIVYPFVDVEYDVSSLDTTIKNASCSQDYQNNGVEKPVIEVPFYSPTFSLPVAVDLIAESLGAGGLGPNPVNLQVPWAHPMIGVSNGGESPSPLDLKVGAGDDFDLGCFVSIPPIYVSSV
jgi:hypothetical protein